MGLICRQLPRPGDAGRRIRPSAGTSKFGVARGVMGFGLFPVEPAFRPDDVGHLAVQPSDAGINSPRAAKISFYSGRTADLAVRENEAVGLVLGGGSSGDVTTTQTIDLAFLKPGGGRAENEIHMAGNVTIVKVLMPAIEK